MMRVLRDSKGSLNRTYYQCTKNKSGVADLSGNVDFGSLDKRQKKAINESNDKIRYLERNKARLKKKKS
tara:strand:- start:244 stop:450 length:207 start_codon:yes stop_codon:yes gene_type:complete